MWRLWWADPCPRLCLNSRGINTVLTPWACSSNDSKAMVLMGTHRDPFTWCEAKERETEVSFEDMKGQFSIEDEPRTTFFLLNKSLPFCLLARRWMMWLLLHALYLLDLHGLYSVQILTFLFWPASKLIFHRSPTNLLPKYVHQKRTQHLLKVQNKTQEEWFKKIYLNSCYASLHRIKPVATAFLASVDIFTKF